MIPSSIRIDDYQQNYNAARKNFYSNREFHTVVNRRLRYFKKWLQSNFDYVIIDCPPSLPIQVQMLVKVADAYIVPCVPDKLSVRGTAYLIDRLRRKNIKLPGLGLLWSLYKQANSVHRQMVPLVIRKKKELFEEFPVPFQTIVPNATAIVRAMEITSNSLNEKYTYLFAKMYKALAAEIVERCEKLDKPRRSKRPRRKLASV